MSIGRGTAPASSGRHRGKEAYPQRFQVQTKHPARAKAGLELLLTPHLRFAKLASRAAAWPLVTARVTVRPQDFLGEIFIGGSNKARVLRAVTDDYLRRSGLDIKLDHGVDNMAMAMSLVASTRGLALMPAYAKNLLPESVVSRPLDGEAPTIDVAIGYSKSNTSPVLKLFLSRLEELVQPNKTQ